MAEFGGALGVLADGAVMRGVARVGAMPLVFDPLLIAGSFCGAVFLGRAAGA